MLKLCSVRAALVLVAVSGPALAQAGPSPTLGDSLDAVTCRSRTLTLCEGEFCFTTFGGPEDDLTMTLDIRAKTYEVPAVAPGTKPMRVVESTGKPESYDLKFGIALAHGQPGNVQFIAHRAKDGTVVASAAERHVYPGNQTRGPITAITAYQCSAGHR